MARKKNKDKRSSRGDGRSLREQVGNAWVLLVVILLGGIYYWTIGRDTSSTRQASQRGIRITSRSTPSPMPRKSGPGARPSRATAETDLAPCTGQLPPNGVRLIQQSISADVADCLRGAALQPGDPATPTSMSLTLGVGGVLEQLEVEAESGASPQFISCLQGEAPGWQLPAPQGGACARVTIPFGLPPRPSPSESPPSREQEGSVSQPVEEDVQGGGP
jgi:hypothetical protein